MSRKRYAVLMTAGAEQDIADIHDYVTAVDCAAHADHILNSILQRIGALEQQPERGTYPKELLALGIREYRQVLATPYRIIYRVQDSRVIVYLVADGRRDMQSLLSRRLLTSRP